MQEASVIRHHRFGFGIAFAGKQPSFSLRSYLATYIKQKIRREPIGIGRIVVVRVPVRVDIAEVGSVVVIG